MLQPHFQVNKFYVIECFDVIFFLHFFILATPFFDFIPIVEPLVFTKGQGRGSSSCTEITIVSDIYLEMEEVFEVLLILNTEDLFTAIIPAGKDRALVTISDSKEERNSMYVAMSVIQNKYFPYGYS